MTPTLVVHEPVPGEVVTEPMMLRAGDVVRAIGVDVTLGERATSAAFGPGWVVVGIPSRLFVSDGAVRRGEYTFVARGMPTEEALVAAEAEVFGVLDARRSAAYRAEIVELRTALEFERTRLRQMHRRAQRAEGATSPDVTWEDGYMTGWRRARRGEGYVDPNPYLDDTGPRAVARRTPTALLGEPDAPR